MSIFAIRCFDELPAQLANENVDNLHFRLIYAAVKMVEEHFLTYRGCFSQT